MSWFTNLRDKIEAFFTSEASKVGASVTTSATTLVVAPVMVVPPVTAAPALIQIATPVVVAPSVQKGANMGQVKQDKDYVSNVSDADFASFMRGGKTPPVDRAAFLASIKHLTGVNGKGVQISGDMLLAPTRYGFADKTAAAAWNAAVELAKD